MNGREALKVVREHRKKMLEQYHRNKKDPDKIQRRKEYDRKRWLEKKAQKREGNYPFTTSKTEI